MGYLWLGIEHLWLVVGSFWLKGLICQVGLVRPVVMARAAEQEVLAAGLQAQNVCLQIIGVQS